MTSIGLERTCVWGRAVGGESKTEIEIGMLDARPQYLQVKSGHAVSPPKFHDSMRPAPLTPGAGAGAVTGLYHLLPVRTTQDKQMGATV